ncbi:adhesive plaque matrix protein-like [Lingula anatina]|uniref:Adhesive plaque matrix protein-like n=1 Tax=Lingula anatina TaxID=7574 RepID=A0A1S3JYF2_LINAN|nr:adhesive plaque matrix protein-like [Lingula anatina]|eukprot:XP_013415445.1 adhesive plaque matrix protein-like [Lingula anatina]
MKILQVLFVAIGVAAARSAPYPPQGYGQQESYEPQGYQQPTYPPPTYPTTYPPSTYPTTYPTTYPPPTYPTTYPTTYPPSTYPTTYPTTYPPTTYPPSTYPPSTYPPPVYHPSYQCSHEYFQCPPLNSVYRVDHYGKHTQVYAPHRFYYEHSDPRCYIQCDEAGNAFSRPCPYGQVYNRYLTDYNNVNVCVPDLSPIENCWYAVDRAVRKRGPTGYMEVLKQFPVEG